MGSCGCGDFHGDWQFPGPGRDTYVLEVHPGCQDCGTAAGVMLYRFSPPEARTWGIDSPQTRVPGLPVDREGLGVPVLDPKVLAELMAKWAGPNVAEYDADGLVHDGVRACFEDAVRATRRGK
jgi:hypothetical protein